MFGAWGAVAGLVGVRVRLGVRSTHRLRRRSWLRGARARDWRPGVSVSRCTYACMYSVETNHSCSVLFMLDVNNSNKVIRTARGAISGSDSMTYVA